MKRRTTSVAVATVLAGLLAGCANGGPGINGLVSKANTAVESVIGSVTGGSGGSGNALTNAAGPVYTPISGGNTLSGLFAGQNRKRSIGHALAL
ncbi:hypothetical protein [Burkholderia pseudomallei]|uniref:hypothetical protein n=1 Tax=Burkholderia pseudomallei TaxID=28450 RepID=UPI0019DF9F13|nr:hypothetical protein [Burkholderia pseudomallei]MBF3830786.1 hypothetical protein [Burkholderia pseudomallei]